MRQFLALARTLHFGRAASQCHVSTSTLSRTITRLEQQAGAPLFTRDRRTVELTPQGERFVAYATDTLDRWEQLERSVRDADPLTGRPPLFCTVTASQSILPAMLGRFRERYPGVHIQLDTGYAANALAMLHEEGVDLTIAALPERLPKALVAHTLAVTPLVFVAPAGSSDVAAMVSTREVAWGSIPMVLPPEGLARTYVERWFRAKGVRPRLYSEVPSHEAILSLVALGCGVGVVPALVLEKSALRDEVRALDVRPRLPNFHVGVCTRRRSLRTPLVGAFW